MENNIMLYAKNKKAFYDYFVEDRFEAGISLQGNEASSIKKNGCSISGSWVDIENGEAFVLGMNIPKHDTSSVFAADPLREKKLLLHKKEIQKLINAVDEKGKTIIPISVYCRDNLVKMEIAICQGKKKYDKRHAIADRDAKRKISSALKERQK